jgi:prepilin-type N-terminal cleavage/methylation domain-containing protein
MTYSTHEVSRHRDGRYAGGFTLIEIMVVVIIIGLLAAVIVQIGRASCRERV